MTTPMHPASNSNEFARIRDGMIRRLVEKHPTTAAMLVSLRLFPNQKKASERLHRLVEKRQVRLLGTVAFKNGRPEHVYCQRTVKTDNLRHEVQLTWLCLKTDADEVRRGPGDTDPVLLPDAEFWINGQRFYVELDCGTMHPQDVVRKRFSKYQSVQDLVLWVCPTESRMETLRRQADSIRAVALFTTLARALQDPHAVIWMDADGKRAALPRSAWDGKKKVQKILREKYGEKGRENGGAFSPPGCGPGTTPFPAAPFSRPSSGDADPGARTPPSPGASPFIPPRT